MSYLTMTQTSANITATASTAVAASGRRKYLGLQNTGAEIVFLNFGGTATTAGWALAAGASLIFSDDVPVGAVSAICAATKTSTLAVVQG